MIKKMSRNLMKVNILGQEDAYKVVDILVNSGYPCAINSIDEDCFEVMIGAYGSENVAQDEFLVI